MYDAFEYKSKYYVSKVSYIFLYISSQLIRTFEQIKSFKMAKKLTILFILISLFAGRANSQITRLKVGFIPYTDPEFAIAEHRELAYKNIYEMALRIFINTQRFTVLDRSSFNIIKLEKEFQTGEDLINSEIIDQGKILAAQVIIIAKIATFAVNEADDGEGFSVFMTAEVKQIDVESGKAVRAMQLKSEVIDGKANFLSGVGVKKKRIKTAEEAINLAVNKMENDLDVWIKDQFTLMMAVIDKSDSDMGLIVDGGKQTGLTKSYKLRVVKQTMMGGKKYYDTLAKLTFSSEGLGEETTKLVITNKLDWDKVLKAWEEDKASVIVLEDNR